MEQQNTAKNTEGPRCPGCPNHCLLSALHCGKGRNLLKQRELLGEDERTPKEK